jgi:hypothetical protein
LVWYSIFQRGVVYQPNLIKRSLDNSRKDQLGSREAFADAYVDYLNTLYEDEWFSKDKELDGLSVWGGVALKIGDAGELAMDGSDGGAKRTGMLIRLMTSAVASRDVGGYSHLKTKLNTLGLKGAKSTIVHGYMRYMKAKDSVSGNLKDDAVYTASAEKLLESILREIAEAEKI